MADYGFYDDCILCGRRIAWSDKRVTISRNLEQDDSEGMTNVLDREDLITICGQCGDRFPARAIRVSFGDSKQ